MNRKHRSMLLFCLSALGTVLIWFSLATPSRAHWADMAAAEIVVDQTTVQMTLTFPTKLTPFADDNQDGQLSNDEVNTHVNRLQDFLGQSIRLTSANNQAGSITVKPLAQGTLPPTVKAAPNTHSTIQLTYSWLKPLQGLKIHYNLFLPGISTASCLATILQNHQIKTFVFTPKNQLLALTPGFADYTTRGLLLAIVGAVVWGAMHSLSPGHGKTLVGAYLVGTRATPRHAIFLAITTTITHTLGIFALGLLTLFASRYVLPEQLYPWISLLSGLMVVGIGFNLFWSRFKDRASHHSHNHNHSHDHDHHFHGHHSHNHHCSCDEHSHSHNYRDNAQLSTLLLSDKPQIEAESHPEHIHLDSQIYHPHHQKIEYQKHHQAHTHERHTHSHIHHKHIHHADHHVHSHLFPGADGAVTWRSLIMLGISGGLVPCPAALVLLLSCIALGNVSLGLLMVLAFSLGLAGVLMGLGLLMVYAKQFFRRLPTPKRTAKLLPAFSAVGIVAIGVGLSTQALMQIIGN